MWRTVAGAVTDVLCHGCILAPDACTCVSVVSDVPERSPDSFTVRAERGPLHPGSAPQSRLEKVWPALSAALGLTLLEAAQLAHGVQQAVAWCRVAARWLAAVPARARRALVGALVLRWGWELRGQRYGKWSAQSIAGVSTITCDGLWEFLAWTWRFRLTLATLAQALKSSEEAFYKTDAEKERLRDANAESAERALRLEFRLAKVGAALEATGGDLADARDELEDLRERLRALKGRSAAWKELFGRALALAAHQHARARRFEERDTRARRLAERLIERADSDSAYSLRELRTMRGLVRAERREAAELRRACEWALDALEDPDTAWTPAGTDTRQELRRVLGERRAPQCSICGVDWCRPATCQRASMVARLRGSTP